MHVAVAVGNHERMDKWEKEPMKLEEMKTYGRKSKKKCVVVEVVVAY